VIRELAPHGRIQLTSDEFAQRYRQRLDRLSVDRVVALLEATRSLTPSELGHARLDTTAVDARLANAERRAPAARVKW
jgi:hypothetical protein